MQPIAQRLKSYLSALFFVVLALATASLLIACRSSRDGPAPTFALPSTPVPSPGATVTVERGDIVESVESRGRLEAKQEANLMFPLDGALKAVHVSPGDEVGAGQLLAEIDAPELQRQVLDREFDLAAAELALTRAELTADSQAALLQVELDQAELALTQAQRSQEMSGTLEIAQAQLEVAKRAAWLDTAASELEIEIARRQVDLARARSQSAPAEETAAGQIGVSIAELQLDQTTTTNRFEDSLAYAQLALAEAQYAQTVSSARLATENAVQAAELNLQLAQVSSHLLTATYELDVAGARLDVDRAQTLHRLAIEQLSNTLLLAPFDGIIVAIEKRAGDQVEAYEAIGVLADPSELWIVATVVAEDIDRITVGQPATIRLDAYPNQAYTGSVLQIASQSDLWQGRSAYEVTIAFDEGQDVPAIIRMGANVSIAGRSKENVLLVPSRAIITISGRQYVEIVAEDGEIERVEVQTGLSNGTQTEILAGLEAGQVIRMP